MRPVDAGLIALGFLCGSIPFGVIFTKGKGIDLKKVGSGNIGATNVLRAAGKLPAAMTLLADMLKGIAGIAICRVTGAESVVVGLAGLAAVVGHCYSPLMKFKGGKGVATGIGAAIGFSPSVGGLVILTWLITAAATRYSSLSALVSFSIMPVFMFLMGNPMDIIIVSVIISLLIIIRHASNIRGLLSGEERRIGEKT